MLLSEPVSSNCGFGTLGILRRFCGSNVLHLEDHGIGVLIRLKSQTRDLALPTT